jgi:hypothetical protein
MRTYAGKQINMSTPRDIVAYRVPLTAAGLGASNDGHHDEISLVITLLPTGQLVVARFVVGCEKASTLITTEQRKLRAQ